MPHRSVPLALAWNILEYQSKKSQPTYPIHAEIIHLTFINTLYHKGYDMK